MAAGVETCRGNIWLCEIDTGAEAWDSKPLNVERTYFQELFSGTDPVIPYYKTSKAGELPWSYAALRRLICECDEQGRQVVPAIWLPELSGQSFV